MLLYKAPRFKDQDGTAAGIPERVVKLSRDTYEERSGGDGTEPCDTGDGTMVTWMDHHQMLGKEWA